VIDRDEIETTSKHLGVHTSDVQRDYLYSWLLAGLYGDNPLVRERLVLKGGNAFRKSYFVNTGSRAISTSPPQPGCIPSSCWTH
jgi:predicted nucleotidyltransferase component of viral defense system